MINMLAVVPDPWITESKVTGTSSDDGVLSDASVEVRLSDDQRFTLRTLVRLGERIGSAGSLHGTMTDAASVAALAASSLMLQVIPAGLPRDEMTKLMNAADTDSRALARDRAGWTFTPMVIGGATYALWHRSHTLGFVAHADLGDRVLAAWGTGDLPLVIHRMQLIELVQ
jgi:hypothetical protein